MRMDDSFTHEIGDDQILEQTAQRLVGSVTVEPCACFVPVDDTTVTIVTLHRYLRQALQQCAKALLTFQILLAYKRYGFVVFRCVDSRVDRRSPQKPEQPPLEALLGDHRTSS